MKDANQDAPLSPKERMLEAQAVMREDMQASIAMAQAAWRDANAEAQTAGTEVDLETCLRYCICMSNHSLGDEMTKRAPGLLERARNEGDVQIQIQIYQTLAACQWQQRKLDMALESIRLGRELAVGALNDRAHLALLFDLEGVVMQNSGRLDESLVAYSQGGALWKELGLVEKQVSNGVNHASALQHGGRLAEALEVTLEVRQLLTNHTDAVLKGRLSFNLAIIHRALGDSESAKQEAETSLQIRSEVHDGPGTVGAQCILAEVLMDLGQVEEARALTDAARQGVRDYPLPLSRMNFLTAIGELFHRTGDFDAALEAYETALEVRGCDENPRYVLECRYLMMMLALDRGEFQAVAQEVEPLLEQSRGNMTVARNIDLLELGAKSFELCGDYVKALDWQKQRMEMFQGLKLDEADEKLRSLQIKHKLENSLQIQRTLEASQEELEKRVEERTEELLQANQNLEREIEERHFAEAEAVKLQASLRQTERLESLGRLAGGVAHDFNNLLTVVMGSARMLSEDFHAHGGVVNYAEEILKAGRSGSRLTERLLAFSKRWEVRLAEVPVKDLLSNVLFLTERLLGDDVEFVFESDDSDALVVVDGAQLDSVLMNLALNARDSMPNGGVLTVSTTLLEEGDLVNPLQEEATGRVLRILVADQGHGISDENLEFIFDPFFTTKSPDKGTGLGLSSSLGIIQHLGGRLTLVQSSGEGTTFEILLPAIGSEQAKPKGSGPALSAAKRASMESSLRGRSILLVEDDEAVRRLLAMQLRHLGLEVHEAGDGVSALEALKNASPDLIMSDVNMPRMSGPELLRELRKRGVETPLLLASGWPEHHAEAMPEVAGAVAFLQKPFELKQLGEVLSQLTNSGAANGVR